MTTMALHMMRFSHPNTRVTDRTIVPRLTVHTGHGNGERSSEPAGCMGDEEISPDSGNLLALRLRKTAPAATVQAVAYRVQVRIIA